MTKPSRRDIAREILRRRPQSYAERLGIDVARNTPAPLYRWLIAALLFSARISAGQAESAARALFDEGWRTPQKMAAVTWARRVKVLNRAGYARYDESTSRYIAETTALLLDRYGGDLRKLRSAAQEDPARERGLLKDFKGIGEVGVDIFFREVQVAWDELYPFADRKALEVAAALGLGDSAAELAGLVRRRRDLPRLTAGLVAVGLNKEGETILRALD